MSYTRDWLNTNPVDHSLNKNWPGEDRKIRVDIDERLKAQQYGFSTGETNDGIKRLEFRDQAGDPGAGSDVIRVYGKEVSGKTELFAQDEDGNVMQITNGGSPLLGFRAGDMLLSSSTSAPTGWTDVSATYNNEFIRVSSGATLQTSTMPVQTHAHGMNSHTHSTPNHLHNLYSNTSAGGRDTLETVAGGAAANTNHIASSGAGTSGAASGDTENAGATTAYRTLRMYQKD